MVLTLCFQMESKPWQSWTALPPFTSSLMSFPHPHCSKSSPFLLSSHWQAWAQLPWGPHYTQGFIFITLARPGPGLCHHLGEKNQLSQDMLGTWTQWCEMRREEGFWPKKHTQVLERNPGKNRPLVGGIQLHRDNIQSIPRRDAGPTEQALPANHRRLAVAKKQEEAADCRDEHGTTCGDKTRVKRNVKPVSWNLFPHKICPSSIPTGSAEVTCYLSY